jgi:hypothetical protein
VTLGSRDRNRVAGDREATRRMRTVPSIGTNYKALEIRRSADGGDWVLSRLKEDNGTHEPLSLFEDGV